MVGIMGGISAQFVSGMETVSRKSTSNCQKDLVGDRFVVYALACPDPELVEGHAQAYTTSLRRAYCDVCVCFAVLRNKN